MAAKDQLICNFKCICRQCLQKRWDRALFHCRGFLRAIPQLIGEILEKIK